MKRLFIFSALILSFASANAEFKCLDHYGLDYCGIQTPSDDSMNETYCGDHRYYYVWVNSCDKGYVYDQGSGKKTKYKINDFKRKYTGSCGGKPCPNPFNSPKRD